MMPATHFLNEVVIFFVAGAFLATPVLLLNIRWARVLGLIDWPKARGLTENQVPIVGAGLVVLTFSFLCLMSALYGMSPWVLVTGAIMAIMGLLDDRSHLSAADKIFFQAICAAVAVFLDPNIGSAIGDKYGIWGSFLAIIFIVGLTNAVNFIDGIDGLAGIVLFFGALGFIAVSWSSPDRAAYAISAGLIMGSMVTFLYLNVYRRQGFLGNVGSYFFSYLLAVFHLSVTIDAAGPLTRLAFPGLCFIVPLSDAVMVTLARLMTRRSPFQADKGHLHHRLVQSSLPLRYILANFATIEIVGVLLTALISFNELLRVSLLPAVLCGGFMAITALLILLVEKASRLRLFGFFSRLDRGEPIYFLKYKVRDRNGNVPSVGQLRRIEALISAEIRVTDLCVCEEPDGLFITLRTLPEPLKGISSRLEAIFHAERNITAVVIERGEFTKVTSPANTESVAV